MARQESVRKNNRPYVDSSANSAPRKGTSSPVKTKALPALPNGVPSNSHLQGVSYAEKAIQNARYSMGDTSRPQSYPAVTQDNDMIEPRAISRVPVRQSSLRAGAYTQRLEQPNFHLDSAVAESKKKDAELQRLMSEMDQVRQDSLRKKDDEIERLKADIQYLKKSSTEKDSEIERLKAEMEQLGRNSIKDKDIEIERLKDDMEQLKIDWLQASAELAHARFTANHTVEDQHFVDVWMRLRYEIRSWATKHFNGWSSVSWLRSQMTSRMTSLKHLSTEWKSYLKSPEHRPLLVQAFVWNILSVNVFASGGKVPKGGPIKGAYWTTENQSSIADLQSSLRPTIASMKKNREIGDYATYIKVWLSWRINTILFVQRRQRGATSAQLNAPIRPLIRQIQEVVGPLKTSSSEAQPFGRELEDILAMAVELDAVMWKQRAYFFPSEPPCGRGETKIIFDEKEMDRWDGADPNSSDVDKEVTLVISPRLMKAGNSDGEGYEHFSTKVKSEVSCTKCFDGSTTFRSPFSSSYRSKSQSTVTVAQETQLVLYTKGPGPSRMGSVRSHSRKEPGRFSADMGRH